MRALLAGLAGALLLASLAFAEVAVPPLTARVTDLSGVFEDTRRGALEERLRAFEARKGAQLAVLVLPSTQPETIEQYGIRVADAWKLGRKGIDDGLILIVATDDRRLRIEVGRGLEGVVPDVIARRVIEEIITPYFRAADLPGGIEAGAERLMGLVDGEPLPPPPEPVTGGSGAPVIVALLMGLTVGSVLRRVLGPLLGSGIVGGVTAVVLMAAGFAVLAAILLGVLMFMFVLVFGSVTDRGAFHGGFGGGGSGGGGFGGGGGGFSGGGGGFSGGGASGSW